MLTINIDLEDRLVNGLVVKLMYLRYVNDEVLVIYVKFTKMQGSKQFSLTYLQDNETGFLSRNMKRFSQSKKINYRHQLKELNFH